MPAAKVEFNNRQKALDGILNFGHREESFWVRHETAYDESACVLLMPLFIVLCDSLEHRSGFQYKSW